MTNFKSIWITATHNTLKKEVGLIIAPSYSYSSSRSTRTAPRAFGATVEPRDSNAAARCTVAFHDATMALIVNDGRRQLAQVGN